MAFLVETIKSVDYRNIFNRFLETMQTKVVDKKAQNVGQFFFQLNDLICHEMKFIKWVMV